MSTYRQDNMTIHNQDCMDIMAGYEDDYFDLAVVDPPYGIGFDGHNQIIGKSGKKRGFDKKKLYRKKDWDSSRPQKKYFTELQRVSKNQIIWGGNYFADLLNPVKCWIYWDKVPNGKDLTFSDGELAWCSFDKPLRSISIPWIGFGMVNSGEKKIHPTQKPVKLYNWIYANYAEEGQKILDTHGGSFSNAIAAHYAGMEFVGCELDNDYYLAAIERIKKETSQLAFDF